MGWVGVEVLWWQEELEVLEGLDRAVMGLLRAEVALELEERELSSPPFLQTLESY